MRLLRWCPQPNFLVIPSDCVCDYDEIAEVASSVKLAGNVTVGVVPSADMDSVFTAGASSVADYQERNADTDESIVELEAIVVGAVSKGAPCFLTVEFMIDTGCQVTILATLVLSKCV